MHIPDIIAHRGASRECLENTMAAFARALEQRADGIELDVHGTADGQLVVHHDPVLRLDHGGVHQDAVAIRALTLSDLRGIRLAGDHRLPLLEDVFDLVGARATVFVEVKAPRIEGAVAALLDRYPQVRAAVHSFDHRVPVAVRAIRPQTATGVLCDLYPIALAGLLQPAAPDTLWQYTHLLDEELVETAHALGVKVIAWTENDPARARQLAAWGVDGLCTDVPATVRAAFYPI